MQGLMRRSRSFLDVGANAGYYTLMALAVDPSIEILSLEPNPRAYRELQFNLQLVADAESVTCLNCGAAESAVSSASLHVPRVSGTGGGSLRDLHPNEGAPEVIAVALAPLDELALGRSVDLMKIDVEGAELSVLRGARRLLERSRPTIMIELMRKWMGAYGNHPQDAVHLLTNLGYQAFGVRPGSVDPIRSIDEGTIQTNFIFAHPARQDHLGLLVGAVGS